MQTKKINLARGMEDLYGEEILYRREIEKRVRKIFDEFSFQELVTPAIERMSCFSLALGDASEILDKQMYMVSHDGETHTKDENEKLVLRPEGTAPLMRAVFEHQLLSSLEEVREVKKFFYFLPMYRYEKPQKGRLREFYQIGIELLGVSHPFSDVEAVDLLLHIIHSLGLGSQYELLVSSVGCQHCKKEYLQLLVNYLDNKTKDLCSDCQVRVIKNPLRVFDCKVPTCQTLLRQKETPIMLEHLCTDCQWHHTSFLNSLKQLHIRYTEDPYLVRGLDYYQKTAFEIICHQGLGSQNAIGGGGRYDELSYRFSDKRIPSVGWALGFERLLLALENNKKSFMPDMSHWTLLYLIPLNEEALRQLFFISLEMKKMGVSVELSYFFDKKLKQQLKYAANNNFSFVIILGEDEIRENIFIFKSMKQREEKKVSPLSAHKIMECMKNL